MFVFMPFYINVSVVVAFIDHKTFNVIIQWWDAFSKFVVQISLTNKCGRYSLSTIIVELRSGSCSETVFT